MVTRRRLGVEIIDNGPPTDLGSNEVTFGTARVHVKRDTESTTPFMVLNELVCTRLAMAVGVPVPMGDVGSPGIKTTFVSAQILLDGQELPPADVTSAIEANPSEAALIAAFDVLTWNDDRHEDNLLYHPDVGLWAIDHELALGGMDAFEPGFLDSHQASPTHHRALASVGSDMVAMKGASDKILGLSKHAIEAAVREGQARGLLTVPQATTLADFIEYRRDNIQTLVGASAKLSGGNGEEGTWMTESLPGT